MKVSRLRDYARATLANPGFALGYVEFLMGGTAATAFGGQLRAGTYSELMSARSLALSEGELKLLGRLAPEGICFDVGAHIGIWTVPLALGYPRAQVHSFEGSPSTFITLQNNIARNRITNVTLVQAAACNRSGTVSFQMPGGSIWGRIASTGNSRGRYNQAEKVDVPALELAEYCRSKHINCIEFCKVDVEGAEVEVLEGLAPMLKSHNVKNIWIEIDDVNLSDFGYSVSELYDVLAEYRYDLYHQSDLTTPIDIRVEHSSNMLARPTSR
jgi:FkbM family methyltransferase